MWASAVLGAARDMRVVLPLIQALKHNHPLAREYAARALMQQTEEQPLALKVLSDANLTAAQRLATLEAMKYVRYHGRDLNWNSTLPSIPLFCRDLLRRTDVEGAVKAGAGSVLEELHKQSEGATLLRASQRDPEQDGGVLLRGAAPAEGVSSPEELMRPSNAPSETEPKKNLRDRFFHQE